MNSPAAVPTARRSLRGGARRLLALTAAPAFLALTACGPLLSFPVDDPLGLDQAQVAVSLGPSSLTGLAPAAADGSGEATVAFDDLDLSELPFTPGTLTNDLTIATASLDAGAADAPATIALSGISVDVYLWHGADAYEDASPANRVLVQQNVAGTFNLDRGTCGANSCSYTYDGGIPALGKLNLSGTAFASAYGIITGAPEPNRVRLVVTLEAEPEADLTGRTLTITVDAEQGSIGF